MRRVGWALGLAYLAALVVYVWPKSKEPLPSPSGAYLLDLREKSPNRGAACVFSREGAEVWCSKAAFPINKGVVLSWGETDEFVWAYSFDYGTYVYRRPNPTAPAWREVQFVDHRHETPERIRDCCFEPDYDWNRELNGVLLDDDE